MRIPEGGRGRGREHLLCICVCLVFLSAVDSNKLWHVNVSLHAPQSFVLFNPLCVFLSLIYHILSSLDEKIRKRRHSSSIQINYARAARMITHSGIPFADFGSNTFWQLTAFCGQEATDNTRLLQRSKNNRISTTWVATEVARILKGHD